MNADLKTKLLAALRSGDYTQTRGRLRDDTGFCALGVLCDVSGIGVWRREGDGSFCFLGPDEKANATYLPRALAEDVPKPLQRELTKMNDNGMLFSAIADWIEENL